MSPEFPYQLVAFLNKQPESGEPIYDGPNGWYPQIALKRRFKAKGITEEQLTEKIQSFCEQLGSLAVKTGELIKPERMPVQVIEILNTDELMKLHMDFIAHMGSGIESRFPERDGINYLPHITAEYYDRFVIDVDAYTNSSFNLNKVCLIKDAANEDSEAYRYFSLRQD